MSVCGFLVGLLELTFLLQIAEEEEDFSFIDPAILQQFQSFSVVSIEKIQKEIFNFEEKGW
jgi:hypothetical protein